MSQTGPAKERALVLRSIRHGETSRVVTLFGENFGKIAVLAKGARTGKSSALGGALDAPGLIEAVVHVKSSRSVQILGQTTLIDSFQGIKGDIARTAYAMVICELLMKGFTDGEANSGAFQISLNAFSKLTRSEHDPQFVLIGFMLSLAESLGFGIEVEVCPICGATPSRTGLRNSFLLEVGAAICFDCHSELQDTIPVSGESLAFLRQVKHGSISLERLKVSHRAREEVTLLLLRHLKFHHSGYNYLPSFEMLKTLTDG